MTLFVLCLSGNISVDESPRSVDRLRLANQHSQTRHATLFISIFIRQLRIISFGGLSLTVGARLVVHEWERESIPANWSNTRDIGTFWPTCQNRSEQVSGRGSLSPGDTQSPRTSYLLTDSNRPRLEGKKKKKKKLLSVEVLSAAIVSVILHSSNALQGSFLSFRPFTRTTIHWLKTYLNWLLLLFTDLRSGLVVYVYENHRVFWHGKSCESMIYHMRSDFTKNRWFFFLSFWHG